MAASHDIEDAATFVVSSGGLCFGHPHNIRHGAGQALRPFALVPAQSAGTVITHDHAFNIPAENGRWHVQRILHQETKETAAFFCFHESVLQPLDELRRILGVSGSPYEEESGHCVNTETTFNNRVMVINRYDWGQFDNRGDADDDECQNLPPGSLCLLIDYAASTAVLQHSWNAVSSSQHDLMLLQADEDIAVGARMLLVEHDYEFGRFSFNHDNSKAVSFVFFSSFTEFFESTLQGKVIRVKQTSEENLLEDASFFEGWMASTFAPRIKLHRGGKVYFEHVPRQRPSDLLAFPNDACIVQAENIVELLSRPEFVDDIRMHEPSQHVVVRLLDNCIQTFLTHLISQIGPTSSSKAVNKRLAAVIASSYEPAGPEDTLAARIGYHLGGTEKEDLTRFPELLKRVCTYLRERGVHADQRVSARITSCVVLLLSEIADLALEAALLWDHDIMTPGAIRDGIFQSEEHLSVFQRTEFLWPPASMKPEDMWGYSGPPMEQS